MVTDAPGQREQVIFMSHSIIVIIELVFIHFVIHVHQCLMRKVITRSDTWNNKAFDINSVEWHPWQHNSEIMWIFWSFVCWWNTEIEPERTRTRMLSKYTEKQETARSYLMAFHVVRARIYRINQLPIDAEETNGYILRTVQYVHREMIQLKIDWKLIQCGRLKHNPTALSGALCFRELFIIHIHL